MKDQAASGVPIQAKPAGLSAMMSLQASLQKKVIGGAIQNAVTNAPANIRVNDKGQLLYPDGSPVPLVVPMPPSEKKALLKEVREEFKPLITKMVDELCRQALDPFKKSLRKMEADIIINKNELSEQFAAELKETISQFQKIVDDLKKDIEEAKRSFQRLRARDKSDNDMIFEKHGTDLFSHKALLDDHSTHFEAMASVITMLIENINMQMESEVADLVDRKMIALYGAAHPKLDKIDVTGTSKLLQDMKNGRKDLRDSIIGQENPLDNIQPPVSQPSVVTAADD